MNNSWWWLGGAGLLVVVVAALYALGLGGVARILRAVIGFAADTAVWLRDWLRQPGNKTRGLCGVFAFLFLAAGLQSWQRGTVIIQQRADYTALQGKYTADTASLKQDVASRDAKLDEFTRLAKIEKAKLDAALLENKQAMAEVAALREQARKSAEKYQAEFDRRPPECKAALALMASACPTLKDY